MERNKGFKLKVFHFITDDKFFRGTIAFLDGFEGLENHYFILNRNRDFKYIPLDRIEVADEKKIIQIISNPESCDLIILHSLLSMPCRLIKSIDKQIKVAWFSFGNDTYSNSYPQFPLIQLKNRIKPGTLDAKNWLYYHTKYFVKEYVFRFLRKKNEERKFFIPAIHRIDYYSGVYPMEYDMMCRNKFFRAKQVEYCYVSESIKTLYRKENIYTDPFPCGVNIQVGNSAAILGNHINTFKRLSRLNLKGKKVFTPLSYGGNPTYIASVCKSGKRFWGSNFFPMASFLPRGEYFDLLSSVSFAIYNIDQQGAAGNIRMGLWMGMKIFMPKNSINYRFFKEHGFHVFSIEEDLSQEGIDHCLTKEQIISNRQLLSDSTSFEVLKEKVSNTFRAIREDIFNS